MADYTELRGIVNTQDPAITNLLLENFLSFYDWGFLNKGGYYNYTIPASGGAYGGSFTNLRRQENPNYTTGQVWSAPKKNWVWENDVTFGTPISISGVFVNGSFVNSGYGIDYQNGRVIFDTPVSTSANVQISYSAKWLNIEPAKGIPWFREIQKFSNRVEDSTYTQHGSGNWAQLGKTRVQLPLLAIDVLPAREMLPYQLGGGQMAHNDIVFNIIAEHDWECSNIADVITYQNDRTIYLYDPKQVAASGSLYNYDNTMTGFGAASGHYPSLIENFRHNARCFIFNSRASEVTQLNNDLYMTTVRCTTEVKII